MLIDSHAHLSHTKFDQDLSEVLERAQDAGVEAILNICTTPFEVEKGLQIARIYPFVHLAAATTPHDAQELGEEHFAQMADYAKQGHLTAVGETGLDYHYYRETSVVQKALLIRYLQLAQECALPIVIHCRDAFDDLFALLDEHYPSLPGVLHCFTGTLEEAKGVIERGFYLSLSGIVTFKKSVDLQEVAQTIPLDRLLIETDAPYLAPHPLRSKRNEPSFLSHSARFIAHLRQIPYETLCQSTRTNARTLFHLEK